MPITITTLNNEAGVQKTWEQVNNGTQSSEHRNVTDSTAATPVLIQIRQRKVGQAPNGSPVRQSNVTALMTTPSTVVMPNGNSASKLETFKISVSITGPENASVLTATNRKDLMAYLRNLLTASNIDKLVAGMV